MARKSVPLWIALSLVGAVGAGVYGGYRFVTTSPRFAVAEITILGATRSRDKAAITANSLRGVNVFLANLETLETALEADPWIVTATVERELPNRLRVKISERDVRAAVELGGLYLADDSGEPFKRVDLRAGEGAGLPIITGIARSTFLETPQRARAAIIDALVAYDQYGTDSTRPRIGEIHVDRRRGLTLYTYDSGTAIRIGLADPDELPARLRAFDAAWHSLAEGERTHATTFHVDSAGRTDRVIVGFVQSE